jgi:hypothetical protein
VWESMAYLGIPWFPGLWLIALLAKNSSKRKVVVCRSRITTVTQETIEISIRWKGRCLEHARRKSPGSVNQVSHGRDLRCVMIVGS